MQTFLPYADFRLSAKVLDKKRLVCQRKECTQIWSSLTDPDYGWKNHPAVKQWANCKNLLAAYGYFISLECLERGVADNNDVLGFFSKIMQGYVPPAPWWMGLHEYHLSHRANLLRKDPVYYSQFGWSVSPDLPYYWPSHHEKA